ncbi:MULTISPECIES: hypothetical protein [unclassified Streptomyces]|uniref:Pepco domain-containing protein n=1 Tax=unclassified Streptomyces TaxID=2593676 RepID=UPI002E318116|nr:hypothetical protein [Streptomyces sp. NBC_01268]
MFEKAQSSADATDAALDTLPFLVSIDDRDTAPEPAGAGDKGIFGRRGGHEERDGDGGRTGVRDIPVSVLRDNLQRAVNSLQDVLGTLDVPENGMPLRQAQVSFEVTASGGIAFVGTSAQVAAKGAITLTFGG